LADDDRYIGRGIFSLRADYGSSSRCAGSRPAKSDAATGGSAMHRIVSILTLCVAVCAATAYAQSSPNANPSVSAAAAADIQAILLRLEQQDEELRLLRQRLGTLQNQVRALPPVEPAANVFNPQPVVQASATESPALFELQDRLASLESRVDQQAQQAFNAAPEGYEVGTDLAMTASWHNGLELSTKNKDFRVHVGGRTQLDISAFNNDPALTVSPSVGGIGLQPDSVQLRRGRLRIDGVMYEIFEFAAEYDFVNTLAPAAPSTGQPAATIPAITDLWVTWTKLPMVGNFRVGNVKEPIGMEHIQSSRWLDFIERSFLQDAIFGPFNNGFNPGLYFFDNWGDNDGLWALGAFANNGNPFGYGIGDDWALTGRATWLPVYDEPSNGRYLWHWGLSASVRHPDEDLVRIRTRGNIRSGPPGFLNPIYADTGTMQASQHHLLSLENAAVIGPWTMQAEYTGTWVQSAEQPFAEPAIPVSRGTPFFHGGYVQLLYFLTGEHRAYNRQTGAFDRVVPNTNAFLVNSGDGCCFGRGAWQLGARYAAIDLSDNGINGGILQSGTFGINWWMNPNMHWQFNYDLTHRSAVGTAPPGFINGFGVRFAHDF
jgi:phosphate-selective porin OprO and OprP